MKPCLVGIEACTGSNYWARVFEDCGHEVKIIAPQFVKPYVMSNKNDANDAKGISSVRKLRTILSMNEDKLSPKSLAVFERLYEQFTSYDAQVASFNKDIDLHVASDAICQEIMKIDGIGPISASAVVATVGDARQFKGGRELSAWLGLVPKQHSSGNNIRLGGIHKRGDKYLRTLLIHGARCALIHVDKKIDKKSRWATDKKERLGFNKAAVALANKHTRIIWAMMSSGECYRQEGVCDAA